MKHCTTDKCPQILDSSCVFYEGPTLIYSGINTNDSVETVIQKLNLKLESIPGINLDNYYTKNEADNLFLNYYIKTETYSQTQIDNIVSDLELEIDNKANSSDVYLKTQTYSQTEINGFLSSKADISSLSHVAFSGEYTDLLNKPPIPTKTSDLENDSDFINQISLNAGLLAKQDKLSSYDESILIENNGNIEGNISLFEEYFEQQECELNFTPIQIVAVYQDGIKLSNSEYEIILPKKIKIKEYVDENIQIEYTHLKS